MESRGSERKGSVFLAASGAMSLVLSGQPGNGAERSGFEVRGKEMSGADRIGSERKG